MFQLVTNALGMRRVVEAAGEATSVMSGLQALETRGAGASTQANQRFRGKEAMDHKPNVWTGEKDSELFAAFKRELKNRTGPLGMLPDGEEDWKLKDRTLQQVLMACTKGEATHYVCNPFQIEI